MPAESYVYKKEMHACIISKSMLGLRGLPPRLEGCYMKKILTVVIISAMIAVCSCGAKEGSADNAPAAQSGEAAQAGAEAAQARIPHRYASRAEGQELLMSNEDYYAGFSQNELEFKMQKKGASMEEYKAFAVEQVVDFTQEEIDAIDALLGEMSETLTANGYTLPPLDEIILVKTTMAEECDVTAYTHGTQIYLSDKFMRFDLSDPNGKEKVLYAKFILWHEIFHCLTRCNPDFRAEMYKLVHFTVQEEDYPLPPSAFEYHISNPDVEHHNSYATFIIDGQNIDCFTDFVRGTLNGKGTISSTVRRLLWCRSMGVIYITHLSRQRILTRYSVLTRIMSLIPRSAWLTISAMLWLMVWMGPKETDIPTRRS